MKKIIFAVTAIVIVSVLGAQAIGQNLIINGDFESGNNGFISEYTYVSEVYQNSLGSPGVYSIGINPNLYHSAWASFVDHTTGDTENLMMIVNADATDPDSELPTSPKVVWGQEVTLTECTPTYPVTTETLWAGNGAWEAGEVQVKTSEDGICVKFVLTDAAAIAEGWLITEVHVAVGADPSDIPQKNGNPIPGQFQISEKLDPGVTETDWYCFETDANPVIIAAHAKLGLPEINHIEYHNFCVLSGTEAWVTDPDPDVPATLAWEHPLWNINLTNNLPGDGAKWIWNSERTLEPITGEIVEFSHLFQILGTPTSGMLDITADNGFEAYVNGTVVGDSTNLYDDWRYSDLTETYVDTSAGIPSWGTVRSFDVLDQLTEGLNELSVTGVNEQFDGGTIDSNPAGVIYKLCIESEETVVDREYDSETGWGDGDNFLGKNWATYITYTPEVVCDYGSYLLEFYAASSFSTAPAQLEVKINNVVVPPTLALTSTPGQWVKYSATWAAGAVDYANIEIRDLRYKFSGDDFVIDDISLEQQ